MIERLRAWARTHTDERRYSPVGVAFHWIMAALVVFQLAWGAYASWQFVGGDKLHALQVHSAVGLPILLLATLRLVWRMLIPGPRNDADTLGWWQTAVARVTVVVFYICFFGLPLSGWAMWSAEAPPGPLQLAGIVPWPRMPFDELPLETRWLILDLATDVHDALVIALLLLVPMHVAAALKHHFWERNDVLLGMLPDVPDEPPLQAAQPHTRKAPPLRGASGAG
jgi:cytochrome b561